MYLGGVVSEDTTCDPDVAHRIGLAAGVVISLDTIWKVKDIMKPPKVFLH